MATAPDSLVFCSPPVAHIPLLDRIGPVAAAGFDAISLQPGDVWALEEQGMSAQEIAARIADAGLTVAEVDCAANWMPRQDTAGSSDPSLTELLRSLTAARVVETAARIGARSVVAIDLSPSPPTLDEAAEGFARLCDLADAHGLKAHIEFLPVSAIRSLGDAWAIVEAAGRANGGLTIDAWHFFRSGSTLAELAAIPGERIHTIQLCDAPAAPAADLWAELMTARLLPGEGALDLPGLIRTLDAIGSTAPFGTEVFNTRQTSQPLDQIARDWAGATRAALAQARGNA
jgi:sugar phosphate isomerase/epimerase